MPLRLCITLCLLLCGAAVAADPAASAAGSEATFALKPVRYDPRLPITQSYFVVSGRPGSSSRHEVRIVNVGRGAGTAYVYAVDGTTGQTSGAVYLDRRAPRRDVSTWLDTRPLTLSLAAGESHVIPLEVRIPADARPGDHLGGIVAENAHVRKGSGNGPLRINVRQLTVVAVVVQVPGKARSRLEVTGVAPGGEHGYQYLYLALRNAGENTLTPSGRVSLRDVQGREVVSRDFQLDTFLPRTAIEYPVLLPGQNLVPGRYSATVRIAYGASPFGYRRTNEAAVARTYTFPLTVTARDHEQVFSGAPAVTQPAEARQASAARALPWLLAAFSAAVALVLVVLVVLRRWQPSSSS